MPEHSARGLEAGAEPECRGGGAAVLVPGAECVGPAQQGCGRGSEAGSGGVQAECEDGDRWGDGEGGGVSSGGEVRGVWKG